jgi:hypothetical protein
MRFVRTYLIALLALSVIGLLAVAIVGAATFMAPSNRPRISAVLEPYRLSYVGPSSSGDVMVDVEAAACDRLKPSQYLLVACTLALNVDPRFIAGEAFGGINNDDTPSYEAVIWRARLESDPTICEQGGLLGERLTTCREVASSPDPHVVTRDGVTVTIGG